MLPIASSTSLLASLFSSSGTVLYYSFGVLLVALASLWGITFGYWYVSAWITGRSASEIRMHEAEMNGEKYW